MGSGPSSGPSKTSGGGLVCPGGGPPGHLSGGGEGAPPGQPPGHVSGGAPRTPPGHRAPPPDKAIRVED